MPDQYGHPGIEVYTTYGGDRTYGAPMPHVLQGGDYRVLGCLPPHEDFGGLPKFSDHHDVIPESDWYEIDLSGYDVPILDQGRHGSCVSHGSCTAFWRAWLMAGGTPHEFSPTFIYALGNGGRDAGMIISDALQILMDQGICLASEFPEGQIWKQQVPPQAYETAKRFKIDKAYHAQSFEEIVTGMLMDFIPVYGIYVASDFDHFDSEGVSPAYPGRCGNHCLTGNAVKRLPSRRWAIRTPNSWNARWGDNGCTNLVREHFNRGCDAFLIQAVKEDPQDTTKPPVAA